jgi:hypothetical protein
MASVLLEASRLISFAPKSLMLNVLSGKSGRENSGISNGAFIGAMAFGTSLYLFWPDKA